MSESFRKQDMKAEEQLGEFMDAFFYSKLSGKNGEEVSYERMHDVDSQMKGVDVVIECNNKKYKIDEKAALYYSNSRLSTFAFEINSLQKNQNNEKVLVPGWFINDELDTEYYMLIWPNVICESAYVRRDNAPRKKEYLRKEIGKLTKEDFTIVEAMLIKKAELIKYLRNMFNNKKALWSYAEKLRSECEKCDVKISERLNDKVKICYSGNLYEKPINIVIDKDLLKEKAEEVYLISEDGYATIKG